MLREWGFLIFHVLERRGSTSRMASCSVLNSVSVATKPTPVRRQTSIKSCFSVMFDKCSAEFQSR